MTAFLLYDGRNSKDDVLFEMMHSEGTFARLVELVQTQTVQEDTRLHQMLLELLYESSRIQRLNWEDFSTLAAPDPKCPRPSPDVLTFVSYSGGHRCIHHLPLRDHRRCIKRRR